MKTGLFRRPPETAMLLEHGVRCEHSCAFCSIAAWHRLCGGLRYRARDIEAVAAEMEALYVEGVRIFNFHDDTTTDQNAFP